VGLFMRNVKLLLGLSMGAMLCACSFPRPLQDDVTHLPLSDVIRKITCEARDGLHDIMAAKGHREGEYAAYKQASKDLKNKRKSILKPWEDNSKALDARKKELVAARQALDTEDAALINFFKLVDQMGDEDKAKLVKRMQQLRTRRAELLRELAKFNDDAAAYLRARRKHDMNVRLAEKRIEALTTATRKRFKDLVRYTNHQMSYNFRFKAVETDVITGNASYKLPININLGTLTIGVGGNDTKKRDGERKVSLLISLDDLYETKCDAPAETDGIRAIYYPIRGKIGVHEVFAQYFKILDRAKQDADEASAGEEEQEGDKEKARKIFAKTEAYVDTIVFTTTLSGSLAPAVILNPTPKKQLTASLGISGTREDTHTVTIGLSVPDSDVEDKDKEKITRFQLVDDELVNR